VRSAVRISRSDRTTHRAILSCHMW
jgi:hypothetical protein